MFEFIETPFFAKAVERYLDDDEYAELQAHLNKTLKLASSLRGQAGYANCGGPQRAEASVVVCALSILCVLLGATFGC
jgi:hypothetical protein